MIGIDAVDVERLRALLVRDARIQGRLFTDSERSYCRTKADPVVHLAGTLAVKEAVIKAARLGPLLAWGRRIEVHRRPDGVPGVGIEGHPHRRFDISISHDGPVAVAVAVVSGADGPPTPPRLGTASPRHPRPNERLVHYLRPPAYSGVLEPPDIPTSFEGTDFP